MAGHETSQIQTPTPFGELRLIPGGYNYGASIVSKVGLLAHQLAHGSDKRSPEVIDGVPVSISVSVGANSAFFFPRVLGVALNRAEPVDEDEVGYLVAAESHSLVGYPDKQGCSPSECAAARGLVVLSPASDVVTRGIKGSVTATQNLQGVQGWELDRVLEATYEGACGYGDGQVPLDPRESKLARDVLALMGETGHMFLDPALTKYAAELGCPVPAVQV